MADGDIYPILHSIEEKFSTINENVGYLRGTMERVVAAQDDHSRRIVELERQRYPSMPTARTRPVPVAPVAHPVQVARVNLRRLIYIVSIFLASVGTLIGALAAAGVL